LTELFFNHETDVITHFSAEASSQSASLVETYRENLTVEEGTLTDKLEQYEYQILIEALKKLMGAWLKPQGCWEFHVERCSIK
jgi:arginine utilization regulatory protein